VLLRAVEDKLLDVHQVADQFGVGIAGTVDDLVRCLRFDLADNGLGDLDFHAAVRVGLEGAVVEQRHVDGADGGVVEFFSAEVVPEEGEAPAFAAGEGRECGETESGSSEEKAAARRSGMAFRVHVRPQGRWFGSAGMTCGPDGIAGSGRGVGSGWAPEPSSLN